MSNKGFIYVALLLWRATNTTEVFVAPIVSYLDVADRTMATNVTTLITADGHYR